MKILDRNDIELAGEVILHRISETGAGKALAFMRVATEMPRDDGKAYRDVHRVVALGGTAKKLGNVVEGDHVHVRGRLVYRLGRAEILAFVVEEVRHG